MAGIVAEAVFAEELDDDLRPRLQEAMLTACHGNAKREGGWHGDDMWPSYSNVSLEDVDWLNSGCPSDSSSRGTFDASVLLSRES